LTFDGDGERSSFTADGKRLVVEKHEPVFERGLQVLVETLSRKRLKEWSADCILIHCHDS
jgi:hypothetical protein